MREFIEKLKSKLKEKLLEYINKANDEMIENGHTLDFENFLGHKKAYENVLYEIVNELAEEYKGGCCEWEKHRDYWESKCDYHIEENWFPEIFSVAPDEYHCPYCGKKIKVV